MAEIILCFILVLGGTALVTLAYSDMSLRIEGSLALVLFFAGIVMILLGLPPLLS